MNKLNWCAGFCLYKTLLYLLQVPSRHREDEGDYGESEGKIV